MSKGKETWTVDRPMEKLSCEARQVLASAPNAVTELTAWYSGYYMAETAELNGDFHKTCCAIASTYGDRVPLPDTYYRLDRDDLGHGETTAKPITSWARSHNGARHFYDTFTNGVNRWGTSRYGWRIIRADNPRPLVTYEATMRFLRDTNKDAYEWLHCPEMLGSEEVICLTPDRLEGFAVAEALPRVPLGREEERVIRANTIAGIFGMREAPLPPLGT